MKKRLAYSLLFFFFGLRLLGAWPSSETQPSPELQKKLSREFKKHDYKKVIQIYEQMKERLPESALPLESRVFYGHALADTGAIVSAIEVIQGVLKDLPPGVDATSLKYDLANLLFIEKRYDEADQIYHSMIFQSSRYNEMMMKARERLGLMKQREGKKKDVITLQLLDIESSLEAGEVPDGAETVLKNLLKQKTEEGQAEQIRRVLEKIQELRVQKFKNLLEEARRLFDEEKKYSEVRQILSYIRERYWDVADARSVEALLQEVEARTGKLKN